MSEDPRWLRYRIQYFDIVLHQDVSWFDLKEVAALPAEINDDLEKIQDAFGDKFGNGVNAASAFVGGFACAFGMGWLVALVMLTILPFMGVGAALMGKAVQEVQAESQSWPHGVKSESKRGMCGLSCMLLGWEFT